MILKKKLNIVKEIFSWILLVSMLCLMVYSVYSSVQAKKNDEPFFLLGYRPILVLTGSMEPYMLTNGVCLTKEVTSIDELELGDVITYHMKNEGGKTIRITHRIIAIDNDEIFTKGDNNHVDDGYPLSIDQVESKVIAVCNGTAWIIQKWQTTAGKIMILSFVAFFILLSYLLKSLIRQKMQAKNDTFSSEEADTSVKDEIVVEADIIETTDDSIKS